MSWTVSTLGPFMQSILSTGGSKAEHKLGFTIKEAAHASGLSGSSLYVEIRSGALRARKYRARTIITAPDLNRFLRSLPTLAKADATTPAEAPPRRGRQRKRQPVPTEANAIA